jgi:hypothetical protein
VEVTIQTYDDSLWQAAASTSDAKTVSGIGDAAFKDWPTAGTLNVKAKGYQVVVAVISFTMAADKVDSDDLALANLVLPRL